jgi:hypothetical protein
MVSVKPASVQSRLLEAMLSQIPAGTILVMWDFGDATEPEGMGRAREYGGYGDGGRGIV